MDNNLLFLVGCLAVGFFGALVIGRFLRGPDHVDDELSFSDVLADEELPAGHSTRPE